MCHYSVFFIRHNLTSDEASLDILRNLFYVACCISIKQSTRDIYLIYPKYKAAIPYGLKRNLLNTSILKSRLKVLYIQFPDLIGMKIFELVYRLCGIRANIVDLFNKLNNRLFAK